MRGRHILHRRAWAHVNSRRRTKPTGLNLASRVRKAFFRLTEPRIVKLSERMRELSKERRVLYLRDGQEEVIYTMLMPVTMLPEQLGYLHYVSLTIENALKRLPEIYLQDQAVREVLKVSPDEEAWLADCWGRASAENNPIFSRLDAMVDFISPMWKDTLKFVEPNLSGIGGLHMLPTVEQILDKVIIPVIKEKDPEIQLETGRDIREQHLMQGILEHLQGAQPPGPQHLLYRAQIRRQRPRGTGSAGSLLSRPLQAHDHARRPCRTIFEWRRSAL